MKSVLVFLLLCSSAFAQMNVQLKGDEIVSNTIEQMKKSYNLDCRETKSFIRDADRWAINDRTMNNTIVGYVRDFDCREMNPNRFEKELRYSVTATYFRTEGEKFEITDMKIKPKNYRALNIQSVLANEAITATKNYINTNNYKCNETRNDEDMFMCTYIFAFESCKNIVKLNCRIPTSDPFAKREGLKIKIVSRAKQFDINASEEEIENVYVSNLKFNFYSK